MHVGTAFLVCPLIFGEYQNPFWFAVMHKFWLLVPDVVDISNYYCQTCYFFPVNVSCRVCCVWRYIIFTDKEDLCCFNNYMFTPRCQWQCKNTYATFLNNQDDCDFTISYIIPICVVNFPELKVTLFPFLNINLLWNLLGHIIQLQTVQQNVAVLK